MLLYSFPFPSLDPTQHGGRNSFLEVKAAAQEEVVST